MARPKAENDMKSQSWRHLAGRLGDALFRRGTLGLAAVVLLIIALLVGVLLKGAWPAIKHFGLGFIIGTEWDPVQDKFGALPAVYGTIVSSFLALLIAVPISLGAAIFLTELAPRWLRAPVSFLVELLAALPSIVYGLWGIFVMIPALRPVQLWLGEHASFLPFFRGTPFGPSMMAAGIVLAIMILPIITAVSREVLAAVPVAQKEAAYALGATRWEALRGPVLRYARAGLLGAVILGLGRAMGETIAVTMVIGNSPDISASLLNPAYTLASVLANEFLEATGKLQISALIEFALILFVITIIVNIIARLLVWSVARGGREVVQG